MLPFPAFRNAVVEGTATADFGCKHPSAKLNGRLENTDLREQLQQAVARFIDRPALCELDCTARFRTVRYNTRMPSYF